MAGRPPRRRRRVRKTDRRKKLAIRHAKLDQEVEAQAAKAQRQLTADVAAKEAERKRVRRGHSELKKALPFANEAVRTHTLSATFGRELFERHRAAIDQLRQKVEALSGLGVDISPHIKDWNNVHSWHLEALVALINEATKVYARNL